MLQFICQILTNNNTPIVGMRVACASSTADRIFEGVSTASGIVGPWHQTASPSNLAPQCEGFTQCWLTFAVAEVFRPNDVPWPVINADLNLRTDRTNYILMRCNTTSYTLATSCYSPLEWNTFGFKGCTGPRLIPNHAQPPRLPPTLPRNDGLRGTTAPPFPSPMKDIEYYTEYAGLDQSCHKISQAEGTNSDYPMHDQTQPKKRRGRSSRNRRRRARNCGTSTAESDH
ncbi:hypothetical protein F4802DRAFT_591191 [Xylaria palmicola]|nr:hypothetical protein F4802DRAFT_591191 [Xylaria palmicola]